jgi:hypothetical protein
MAFLEETCITQVKQVGLQGSGFAKPASSESGRQPQGLFIMKPLNKK